MKRRGILLVVLFYHLSHVLAVMAVIYPVSDGSYIICHCRIEMDSKKVPPCFEIFGTLCLLRTHTNIILT